MVQILFHKSNDIWIALSFKILNDVAVCTLLDLWYLIWTMKWRLSILFQMERIPIPLLSILPITFRTTKKKKIYIQQKEVKWIKINLDFIFNYFHIHRIGLQLVYYIIIKVTSYHTNCGSISSDYNFLLAKKRLQFSDVKVTIFY